MKTKYLWVIIVVLAGLVLSCSCAPRSIDTIQGELYDQNYEPGLWYDIATYTLTGGKAITESDNCVASTQWFYEFKVRNGYPLILGQYYIFKAQHIENGEFVLKSVEQVAKP